jgi:hypothetical protein
MSEIEYPERISRLELWRKEDKELNDNRYKETKDRLHKIGNQAASIDEVDYLKTRTDGHEKTLIKISNSLEIFDKWSIRMGGLIAVIIAGSFTAFITFYKPPMPDLEQQMQFQQQMTVAMDTLINLEKQRQPQKSDQA